MSRRFAFSTAVELLRRSALYDGRTERLIECVERDGRIEPTDELCSAMENYTRHMDNETLANELAPLFEEYGLLPSPEESLIRVLAEVRAERRRQYDKWGQQDHPSFGHDRDMAAAKLNERFGKAMVETAAAQGKLSFDAILTEELYEALATESEEKLRAELVQVAAVAVAWIEAIDRRACGKTT